jgi:hypothetical protein
MVLVLLEQLILEVAVVAEAVLLRQLILMVEMVALVWLF